MVCRYREMKAMYVRSYTWNIITSHTRVDGSVAQGKITLKLINYEENKKLLERLPHRKFLDMAIVYQYVMETGQKESATVLINYFHMKIWEV